MSIDIGTADVALAPVASGADRKDLALLTAFVIGFVVIAFFGAVLLVTVPREDRFPTDGPPPASSAEAR